MTANKLRHLVQSEAYKIVCLQLLGVVCLAIVSFIGSGKTTGLSVLLGGLAYGLPNLYFVFRVFRFSGAHEMTKFMAAFFMGEALKLIFSAILFLVIVKYLPVSLLSTLVGFIGAIVSFWIVCMWHFSRRKN